MNDEFRRRYEVPGICSFEGLGVFVTGKALRGRAVQLGYYRWMAEDALVKFLHADIVAAARRKSYRGCFEPDGSILITSADLLI